MISAILAVLFGAMLYEQANAAYGKTRAQVLAASAFGLTLLGLLIGVIAWIAGATFTVVCFVIARKRAMQAVLQEIENEEA